MSSARASVLLAAMEKLDSRATELQGMKELREFIENGGEAVLAEFVHHVLKNLKRRDTHVHAIGECVTLLGECAVAHPTAVAATYLPKLVQVCSPFRAPAAAPRQNVFQALACSRRSCSQAIVRQLSRSDGRCREACCAALAAIASAVAGVDAVDGPPFGPVAGLRLSPFFCPLFAALGEPGRELQEGAAAAIRAVVIQASAPDVAASLPALLPKLLGVLRSAAVAKDAVLGALESALNVAEPSLHVANAPALAQAIAKCLASAPAEFKTRAAAARCAVPLLGTLAPLLAEGGKPVADAVAHIRGAL